MPNIQAYAYSDIIDGVKGKDTAFAVLWAAYGNSVRISTGFSVGIGWYVD